MPIDASSHPFDDGRELDLDDLDRAGTGASASHAGDKAIGAFDDDDDLDKAGKGAGSFHVDDEGTKSFGDGGDDAGLKSFAGGAAVHAEGHDDPFDAKLGLDRALDHAGEDPFHQDHDLSHKHDAVLGHEHDDDDAFAAKHHHVDVDDAAHHDKAHIDIHDID